MIESNSKDLQVITEASKIALDVVNAIKNHNRSRKYDR